MSEVGGYAARIKKEVAYSMVLEEDIDFLDACHRYLEFRSEEAKKISSLRFSISRRNWHITGYLNLKSIPTIFI
jgi:hypothetical protein